MRIEKDAYGVKALPRISLLCFLALHWIACVSLFLANETDNAEILLVCFCLGFFSCFGWLVFCFFSDLDCKLI